MRDTGQSLRRIEKAIAAMLTSETRQAAVMIFLSKGNDRVAGTDVEVWQKQEQFGRKDRKLQSASSKTST